MLHHDAEIATGPGFEDTVQGSADNGEAQFDENPAHWEICHGDGNTVYYYNIETGESRWKRPRFKTDEDYTKMKEGTNSDEHYAKMEMMIQLGNIHEDWESIKDGQGRLYFWNRISGESRWDAPTRTWIPNYHISEENSNINEIDETSISKNDEAKKLPEGWNIESDGNGNQYYYNSTTGESTCKLLLRTFYYFKSYAYNAFSTEINSNHNLLYNYFIFRGISIAGSYY